MMEQSLKRMRYFTEEILRSAKTRSFTDYTCQTILYPLQSFNVPVRKIVQKGIAIVKMTSAHITDFAASGLRCFLIRRKSRK